MIFVDTSYWLALRNRRDPLNEEALCCANLTEREQLVTTDLIRGETWTILRQRAGVRSAKDFLDALDQSPRVTLLRVPPAVQRQALAWLRQYPNFECSFTDATSFIIMRARRIREVLAFNAAFQAAGFTVVRD